MTNLDEFQVLLCLYFVGADTILMLQTMYYERDRGLTTMRVALAFGLFVMWMLPAFMAQSKWSYSRHNGVALTHSTSLDRRAHV